MEKQNNKTGAGEKKKPPTSKRSGLSMEFKSKTLAASFTKSRHDEDDYEYDINADDQSSPNEIPTASCIKGEKGNDGSVSYVDGKDKSMDSLKNAAKSTAKVPEVPSKANWMKDKVSNLWSRKGKADEIEKLENLPKNENDPKASGNLAMTSNEGKLSNDKAHNVSSSPVKEKKDVLEEPSVEIKDGGKDRMQVRAKTGWIRDQVSSLITKGKSYASSGMAGPEVNMNSSAEKSPRKQTSLSDVEDKKSSLAQSISEHYNLKQKVEGQEELQEVNTQEVELANFNINDNISKEVRNMEKDKFIDIHESITRSIAKQTTVTFSKDDKGPQNMENRPSSPQISSLNETRKSSAKSKIKGFLTSKPLTTDLTHIPLSPSSKDDKGKNGANISTQTQTKMKFKFSGKLTFSELLQSQERGTLPSDNEVPVNDSLSSSPVLNRFQESISEDDEDEGIDSVQKDEANLKDGDTKGSTTFFRLWNLSILFYGLYIIPISSFISGILFGALSMYLAGCLLIWLFCPSGKSFEQYRQEIKKYLKEEEILSSSNKPIRSVDPEILRKPRDLKVCFMFKVYFGSVNSRNVFYFIKVIVIFKLIDYGKKL